MLPRIKISYENGLLGTQAENKDGYFLLLGGAVTVAETFALHTAYEVRKLSELGKLGVTAENNPGLYKLVRDFYSIAEEGTKALVMGFERAKKFVDICEFESGILKTAIRDLKGDVRAVFIVRDPSADEEVSVTDGLDEDVFDALPLAQKVGEWSASELYAPIFTVLEGRSYSADMTLKDLSKEKYNRVGIMIGDTESSSKRAAIGLLAGRLAMSPVQRNVGRGKDGALSPPAMYIGDTLVEKNMDEISNMYDKGYITPRIYIGKSGYYFTDDRLAVDPTDDYSHITNRRVIDKAARIAYGTLLNFMLDEIEVNEDGTMQPAIVKNWQTAIEDAVNRSMTAKGELSASNGSGCKCYIDETVNVLATSTINVVLRVRPFGYARFIDVELGFLVTNA